MSVVRRWQFRYRLWWMMGLIGALAVTFAAIASPLDSVALPVLLVLVGAFFLLALYVLLAVVPYSLMIRRLRCPACGEPRLFRSALILFRPPLMSFHLCHGCGARFKRLFAGEWVDARGPDDNRWYPSSGLQPPMEEPEGATPQV